MEKLYTNKTSTKNKLSIKFMAFVVLFIGGLINSYSQVAVDFEPRTSVYTVKGDFTMLGNTNLTLVIPSNNGTNDADMRYVDEDGNLATWNSSSSTLAFSSENGALPECSNILYAGLYWFGRANVGPDDNADGDNNPNTFSITKGSVTKDFDKTKVLLNGPGANGYEEIQANVVNGNDEIYFPSGVDQNIYTAYADITTYVNDTNKGGIGEYFVADMALSEGSSDQNGLSGGWGMVIVYENSKMNWRDITVFDGHAFVGGNGPAETFSFDVDGFNAALGGQVNIKLGVMASEGERNFTSDYLEIEVLNTGTYQRLSADGTGNSTTNFFTSSILTHSLPNMRTPDLFNNTGVDILMFDIPNTGNTIIANGQNATSFRYGSSSDGYAIFNLTFAVDAYVPEPVGVLTNTEINGVPNPPNSTLDPGESAGFNIQLTNRGTEAITNTVLTIPIPTSVDASSLTFNENINFIPTAGYSAPDYDPDTNLGPNGAIVWNLGTLPLTANPDDILAEIGFKLIATQDCAILNDSSFEGTISTNGFISGTGQISNISFNTPLIKGYEQNGACIGEPIPTPIIIDIDYLPYVSTPPTADTPAPINVECISDVPTPDINVVTNPTSISGMPPTVLFVSDTSDGNTCPEIITRRYSVTDDCGNTIFVDQVITINITTPLTIADADGGSTIECIVDATETFTLPTVTDACGNTLTPSTAVITDSSDPLTCEGTRTYTYTYTDCTGNSDAWSYVYTIDLLPFTLPANGTETVDNLADVVEPTPPVVNDNCTNLIIPTGPTVSSIPACQGAIVYTFTYTDCAGNTADWTYTYTLELAPFTAPDDQASAVNCIADAIAPTPPAVTDSNGTNLVPSAPAITDSPDPLTCEGTRTYTYTYTDCAGNSDDWAYVYTIDIPTFTIADTDGAGTVECIADATETFTLPTVTDACGNTVSASAAVITDSPDPLTCEGTKTYTYTYTDCAGNSDTWAYVYTIDLLPFTLPANGTETVDNLTDATEPTPPAVNDNCSNLIVPTGPTVSSIPACQGAIVYTFTYTDCAGNTADWTYTYTLELAPFTAPNDQASTVNCIADAIAPTPPTVTDSNGTNLVPSAPAITESPDPLTCEGTRTYTYTYTDCAGNSDDWAYIYTIDTPTFTIADAEGTSTVECINDATETFTLPTVTDACGNTLAPSAAVITDSPDPLTCEGTRTYTYTYTDCAGNSDDWAYVYTIDIPTFTIADTDGAGTVECIDDATETFTLPTVSDACGNTLTPSAAVITDSPDPLTCEGTRTYTYTYTDCAGNSDDWAYVYTIDIPTFTIADTDGAGTVECIADATETFTLPTVTDACGNTVSASAAVITDSPDPLTCEGTKTYTYTYTDCAGNSDTWAYVYTIDLLPFTLPANGTETVDNLTDATEPTPPAVNDNCSNLIVPTGPTVSSIPACQGAIVYTFTYTDCAGNTADWTYTYTLELAPFTAPNDQASTVNCIADAIAPTPPTVTDSNGTNLVPSAPAITESPDPLTCEGTRTYTYTYTDCAGNSDDWAYIYTIDTPTFTIADAEGTSTVECINDATETFTLPTVTDACGNTLAPSAAVITDSPDPLTCEGTRTYTYTYTDCAGNSDDWAYVYTIDIPTFTIADTDGAGTVECIDDATETFTLPTVSDACGNTLTPSAAVITDSPDPLTCEGTRTYTYTYTDCAGNSDDWAYVYTIDIPTFTIADTDGAGTVECIADATETFTLPTVTDACGNTVSASAAVITDSPDPLTCEGTKTYTYTYTDCAGNSDTWAYVYTIDLLPFTLPANGTETVDNLTDATEPTPPAVNDNCSNLIVPTGPTVSSIPACQGAIVYTFTYTDCAGNTADWTYTYTLELAPFTAPNDQASTVNCIADAIAPTPPTVTDSNGTNLVPSAPAITESPDPLTCEGTRTYTYTYTDCAGNSDDWAYIYTIDTPTFTIADAEGTSTVECINDATETFTLPTVTDACGNTLAPSAAVITDSPDPLTCEGTRTYTYTYTDCAGNSDDWAYVYTIDIPTFTIADTDGAGTVECIDDATETFTLPTVSDACGNTLTPSAAVITDSPDPLTCEGTRTYTYTYTDCVGNTDDWSYNYTIKDTTAPELILPANATAECSDDLSPIDFGTATATDNCDDNPTVTFSDVRTDGACSGTFTITRTWTATDICGNPVSAIQTISTSDTTAPTFDQATLPSDQVVECGNVPDAETLTATDNCGNAIVTVEDVRTDGNCDSNYIITRTYTATDDCGLTNTHIQTLTVQDTIPPTFVEPLPEANITVECDAVPVPETITATDSCSNVTVSVSDTRTDGNCENNYILARTWTAVDDCDNATSYTQIITIKDTKAPEFVETLPRDITVECDAIPDTADITAIDNCGDATVTVKDIRTDGNCPSNYIIARTWTATDECGLTTSHTQTITVQDTTAPVPTSSFEDLIDVSCTDVPDAPALEFSDNCSTNVIVEFNETSTFDDTALLDYQIIRTWTVRDACNNEEIYTQTLNVTLDEIFSEIAAEDRCFEEGIVNLNNYLPNSLNTNGEWEMVEGNPDASLNGSIFDPTILKLSEDFLPGTGGIDYKFRYTTTDMGCISVTEVIMNIHADCVVLPCGENDIAISKAITPNGDGYNDTFDIAGIDLCGFVAEVKVFNRWGALVYESNNYTLGSIDTSGAKGDWDGSSPSSSIGSAGKLPNGTYYFIISLKNSGLSPLTGPVYLGTK